MQHEIEKESMEYFEQTALRIITTILAKKSLCINRNEAEELRKLLFVKNSNFYRFWILKLTDLLENQSYKEYNEKRMIPKRYLLRVLQRKLQENLNFENTPGLFLSPDKEETEIDSERVPRVDVYDGTKSEILRIVQDLIPVIIMSRKWSSIDKKGRIVLGAENGSLTDEILDLAAECSDCIVLDLFLACQVENLAILKRKRNKFRYVILYGKKDRDAATRVSHALIG